MPTSDGRSTRVSPPTTAGRRPARTAVRRSGGPAVADPALPALTGRLVWGDFCSGTLTTATPRTDGFTDVTPLGVSLPAGKAPRAPLNSIGEDGFGRLYFLSNNGSVFRLLAGGTLRR